MKILVVNLLYIGDLLFSTPFLRALHEAYPDAQIDLIVDQRQQEIVAHHPLLTTIIAVDRQRLERIPYLLAFLGEIRRHHYDMVVNLHESEVPSSIAAFSGAKRRCGISVRFFKPFFTEFVHERTDIHQVEAYLEVLRHLGVAYPVHHGLEFFIDAASQQSAEQHWQRAGLSGRPRIIGINTGGSWPTKRWTVEGFADLATLLQQEGYTPVFFGGPTDVPMVEAITARMHLRPAVFTGKLTLLELAALVGKCMAFVSGDSGPMHIAVSQHVPTVAIFGPSDPVRYAPFGPHVLIRSSEPCLACRQHECPHHRCMRSISAEQVYKGLITLLPPGKPTKIDGVYLHASLNRN